MSASEALAPRERDVLELLGQGLSNRDTAARLRPVAPGCGWSSGR